MTTTAVADRTRRGDAGVLQVPLTPGDGSDRPQGRPAHGCTVCGTRWDGFLICHCSICHQTFTSLKGFDKHKPSYNGCLTGDKAGLVPSLRGNGFWATRGGGNRGDDE